MEKKFNHIILDQHKIMQSTFQHEWGGIYDVPVLAEEMSESVAARDRRVIFLHRWYQPLVGDPINRHTHLLAHSSNCN